MKKFLNIVGFLVLFCVVLLLLSRFFHASSPIVSPMKNLSQVTFTPTPILSKPTSTLFVPYWTVSKRPLPTNYNSLAYFGITANSHGINIQEDGYKALPTFEKKVQEGQKTLVVVRLFDSNVNAQVLSDKQLQQKIIADSIEVAQTHHFDGIILDFEYNALAFDSVVKNISLFSQSFADTVHASGLTYYQTIYGDTFYLLRPYEVAAIGKKADGIFVMAYDFHKANGNPGPNFPVNRLADADYSFTEMVQDFTKKVSYTKLTIIFGMFGYDWTLNNKKDSIKPAISVTTSEAEDMFANPCKLKECSLIRDPKEREEHGSYRDSENQLHDVWFEDMTSVKEKEAYLKTQGITSTGYWAYSYFDQ